MLLSYFSTSGDRHADKQTTRKTTNENNFAGVMIICTFCNECEQLDHRNTIAAASVEGEHGVCDWDMVDAIREEDGMEMLTSLLDGGSSVNLPLKVSE